MLGQLGFFVTVGDLCAVTRRSLAGPLTIEAGRWLTVDPAAATNPLPLAARLLLPHIVMRAVAVEMLTSAVTLASARHELGDGPVGITRELSKLSSVGDGCGGLLWVGGGARDAGLGGDREGGGGVSSSKEDTEPSLDVVGLDGIGLGRTTEGRVRFGRDFGRVFGGEGGESGVSTVLLGVDLGVDVALLEHVAND